MGEVYIDGVAQTEFGKDTRKLEVMLADAGIRALNNSECKDPPDRVIIGNYNYQGYGGQASLDSLVGTELEIPTTTPIQRVERGSSTGALAVENGFDYVQQGERVLVISGEKMKLEEHDGRRVTAETSKIIDEGEREFGLTMPVIAAIATTEYMVRYGISEDKIRNLFFQILHKNRDYGSSNPYAYFKEQVLSNDYFDQEKNQWIAKPLTMNDCAGTYNGAAAVYLVPYETDIKLSGIESAFSKIKIDGRRTLTSLDATVDAAIKLFKYTNLNPHEIDIIELHDAFAPVPIIAAEDIGLIERGKGSELILNEKNKDGKTVFYNRSGGFFSKTHPIAASGTAQLVELALQMRSLLQYSEMFEGHQKGINYGLWFSMHGFGFYNSVGIVEKTGCSLKREGLNEKNLPRHFKLPWKPFEKYGKRKIIGMTTLPDGVDDSAGIGVTRTPEGGLRLGHMGDLDKLKLSKRVNIIEEEGGLYFVPVSNLVSRILEKYFGGIRGKLKK